ncbi:MAG: glycosyltransferase family 4 protein [Candidatus Omnitrophota bacterium]
MPFDESLHILHIVASLRGGAAQHVLHLCRELRRQGHACAIAAPADNDSVQRIIESEAIPFHDIAIDSSWFWKKTAELKSFITMPGFTHIHAHGMRAAFWARLARMTAPLAPPLIYTVHGYHPPHYPNAASRLAVHFAEWLLLPQTAAYICVSCGVKESLLHALPQAEDRCFVVENGIPLRETSLERKEEDRRRWREEFSIPPGAFLIGTVARLQWQKGIGRLIQAFAQLEESGSPLYLLIVGDGPDRIELMQLADKTGAGARCLFTGHRADAAEAYDAFDLFVLPSLWEGLPLTVLEAWDAGTVVTATDVLGTRELIENGVTGFLAHNSAEGICSAMQRAMQSQQEFPRLRENAKRTLREQYGAERMAQRTIEVYRLAAGKHA